MVTSNSENYSDSVLQKHASLITYVNRTVTYAGALKAFVAHPALAPKPVEVGGGYHACQKIIDNTGLRLAFLAHGKTYDPPDWYMEARAKAGPLVTQMLEDDRLQILEVFILNSKGGDWEAHRGLRSNAHYLKQRNKLAGSVAFVGDHVASMAARFLESMDRSYAFDTSQVLFHDTQIISSWMNKQAKQHELQFSGHKDDTNQVRTLIRTRVDATLRDQALAKLSVSEADPKNTDNATTYFAEELKGLLTATVPDARQMAVIFEKETGITLDIHSPDSLGFLFGVWGDYLNTVKRMSKVQDESAAKKLWIAFHERQFRVPGVTEKVLKKVINGE